MQLKHCMEHVLNIFIYKFGILINMTELYLDHIINISTGTIRILVISVFWANIRANSISREWKEIFIYCLTCRSIENSLNPRCKRKRIFFKGRSGWKINMGSFDCPLASSPLHTCRNMSYLLPAHIGWTTAV